MNSASASRRSSCPCDGTARPRRLRSHVCVWRLATGRASYLVSSTMVWTNDPRKHLESYRRSSILDRADESHARYSSARGGLIASVIELIDTDAWHGNGARDLASFLAA